MIWAILLGLTVLAMAWIFIPALSFKNYSSDERANAQKLYHDQMTALEEDLTDGLIDEEEAQSARLEIQRRLIRISDQDGTLAPRTDAPMMGLKTLFIVCLMGLGIAFIFYAQIGSPRLEAMRPQTTASAKQLQSDSNLAAQLKQLNDHLQAEPNDKEGWRLLASISTQTEQYQQAATAYGQLARIESENADWWILQAESLIRLARGQVTPAARYSLQTGLMQNPEHPAGRFYLGQALAQDNNHQGALEVWQGLKDVSKPNAPWMAALNARMAQSRQILGIEAPVKETSEGATSNSMSGFSPEQLDMIRGMVGGLDERLKSEGGTLEEWFRLAQSYMVLDDIEGTIRALEGALPLADENMQKEIRAQITKLKNP